MKTVTEIALWFILGALLVLVVTHASGFATAVTAVGGQFNSDLTLLTGQGQTGGTKGNVNYTPGGGYALSA